MATYAQLEAEQWWGREIVTPEVDWLGDELCRRAGVPRSACGTKGNEKHLRGSHRSQEWIKNSRYCTSRSYTVQSGLTAVQARHIAGVDFVPAGWGTSRNRELMIAQTGRLLAAMKAGQLEGVREMFGTTNGRTVTGWNNVENRPASSDDSHLEHWHLGLDRRRCADRNLMEQILAIVLGHDTEDDMQLGDKVDLPTIPGVAYSSNPKSVEQVLGGSYGYIVGNRTMLLEVLANQRQLLGTDFVNEPQIIDGVLTGLGSKDLDEAATALRAAFGDRTAALAAKLVEPAAS